MWFKKSNNLKRNVYAVESGYLIGHFLTIIDYDKENRKYQVLGCKLDVENPKALDIPEKDVMEGIKHGLLTYVETINRNIYRDCKRQYNLLKSTK